MHDSKMKEWELEVQLNEYAYKIVKPLIELRFISSGTNFYRIIQILINLDPIEYNLKD